MRRFALLLTLLIFPATTSGQTPKEKLIPIVEIGTHTWRILETFFSADSKQLITVSEDRTIRFWDVATREQVRTLHMPQGPGSEGEVTAAAMSPDGKVLAVASHWQQQGTNRRGRIYLLDVETGSVQQILEGFRETILQIAFSRDSKWVAALSNKEKDIRIWRVGNTKFQRILEAVAPGYFNYFAFSPDATALAVGSSVSSRPLRIWDLNSGEIKHELQEKQILSSPLCWSADGKTIATAHPDGLRLRNPDLSVRQHGQQFVPCNAVLFSADSSQLAVMWGRNGNKASTLSLVDPVTGKEIVQGQKKVSLTIRSFSPDGSLLVCRDFNSLNLALCQTKDGQIDFVPKSQQPLPYFSAAVGSNKAGTAIGQAKFWSFELRELRFGPAPGADDLQGQVDQEGNLSFGGNFTALSCPILQGGKLLLSLPAPPGDTWTGRGYPQTRTWIGKERLVLGTFKGALYLFQLPEGKLLRRWQGHIGDLRGSIFPLPNSPYVISTGPYPHFCVWSPDQDKPLLNLVMLRTPTKAKDEGEWLAWTPEGFYACSSAAESKFGFLKDYGPDKTPVFMPAALFRKVLNRPDVLKRLLECGSVEKALEAANKARGVKTTFRSAADLVPATVVLDLPVKQGATLTQPQLKVQANVTKPGSQPVLKLQLLLDGRPYQGNKSLVAHVKDQPAFWNVDLPPGSHRLAVVAHTAVSSSRSDDMEITYSPATPADPRRLLPTLYLVSIGINAYPGDWKLSCAVNDATKLADTFHKKGKPPFRDIQHRLLTDKQATRAGILSELTWLKKQMKPQDIAVIFYAGHGTRDDQGHFYLLPVDFDLKALKKTAVSGDELKKRFADLPGRVLVMLDACHSGAIGARNTGGVTDELTRELTDDDCGVVMLCAAMGREEAGEERKLGHGYFALALIKGLSGEAGVSKRDGFVYLHHLHHFVIECVQELSNDEQHPVLGMPTTVRSFALAKPK